MKGCLSLAGKKERFQAVIFDVIHCPGGDKFPAAAVRKHTVESAFLVSVPAGGALMVIFILPHNTGSSVPWTIRINERCSLYCLCFADDRVFSCAYLSHFIQIPFCFKCHGKNVS
jgi:hypothetical protein